MQCPKCGGKGKVLTAGVSAYMAQAEECCRCCGTGLLPETDPLSLLERIDALEATLIAAGIPLYARKPAILDVEELT